MSVITYCEMCREYNAAAVDFRNQAANAQADHTALVEAVKKYFKSERLEILKREARAEVDRLIGEGEG